MGKSADADKKRTGLAAQADVPRITSPLPPVSPRLARWGLTAFGFLFLAQGLGKALDPTGYMGALDAFRVLTPAALSPLTLGALALAWTLVELGAGALILHGGLSRAPARSVTLTGLGLALGISLAYLALDVGALARHLPIDNCTCFGTYVPQGLSWSSLAQKAAVVALLAWLSSATLRSSSRGHAPATTPMRGRALSHA